MSAKEAPKGAAGTPIDSGFDRYSKLILTPLYDSGLELGKLFPDSILFGSILLYCLTQNLSFGVLAIFFLETSLLHQIMGFVYEKSMGPAQQKYTSKTSDAEILNCRSGFRTPRKEWERNFMNDTYPSVSVFFWGSFVAYMVGSNAAFATILNTMGADWRPRIIFSSIAIVLTSIVFLLARHTAWGGCDSTSELILALVSGLVAGTILYFLNYQLFGLEGLNYNGLPILVDKVEEGSKIYVCAPPQ
jgi:hypothetical protein